uniref:Arp2/3 complex 34 kDa subunit n=1 Tax=Haptolina ericina TaxID=156174 RepID=A0A7S3ABG9_9EUKA|mmetsp:Transcript_10509/g.24059  ORF Transcript_10509/g.24059 Transcript_10509/m.24059 type:complete len:316 (+) Transcript_10509:100-1047(+)
MTSSLDGRIHLEPGHRAVGESVAARLNTAAGKREAVKVECSDFDGVKYRVEMLDDKDTLSVSLATRNFAEIKDAVGEKYFLDKYPAMMAQPEDGYSITVKIALSTLPDGGVDAEALVRQLSCMKRDVIGAPLYVCFAALASGSRAPRAHYVINYRPSEAMYVVPSTDLVVVVYSIAFTDPVERAIAKVFLQEIEISRRQSRDLATAPSVTYTQEAPHELKMLRLDLKEPSSPNFVGFVSLAISKRNVEGDKLTKVLSLVEGYRTYLMYHVQGTKSQLHTRIRSRSTNWLQVLNRAMPDKMSTEKKTITGRTFKRG